MSEEWRDVVGYEGLYEVSDLGRVRSSVGVTQRILSPIINSDGYAQIALSLNGVSKKYCVHRLVAVAFLGPADGLQVNHKNGDRTNNSLQNIEWVTHRENILHSIRVLQSQRGGVRRSVVLVKGEEAHTFKTKKDAALFAGVCQAWIGKALRAGRTAGGWKVYYA